MKKVVNKILTVLTLIIVGISAYPNSVLKVYATDTLYGDVNYDGVVNSKDLTRLNKYLNGECELNEQQIKNADVDKSGSINKADLSILMKVLSDYQIKLPIIYGDVNNDGKIDTKDLTMLNQYIAGKIELETQNTMNADINLDETVNNYDLEILRKYIANHNYDEGEDIIIKPVIYGDIDFDGKVSGKDGILITRYVADMIELTYEQLLAADVNLDGFVNDLDLEIMQKHLANWKDYEKLPIIYGDVDFDGKVNTKDRLLIARYVANIIDFTDEQLLVADVNLDGFVNNLDKEIMQKYCAKWTGYEKLPVIYGDVNDDNKVDVKDLDLLDGYLNNSEEISSSGKIKADVNLDGNVNSLDRDIINKYLSKIVSKLPMMCGDLNNDGIADAGDAVLISGYIKGEKELSEEELIKADVNFDGTVNQLDVEQISEYDAGLSKLTILYGDVNCDGIVNNEDYSMVANYIKGNEEITQEGLINADVNLDNVVNNLDVDLINKACLNKIKLPVLYGDINNDGVTDAGDATLVLEYVEGKTEFTEQQKVCADVNVDGSVNYYDATLISKYDAGIIDLPYIFGDVYQDGIINIKDRLMLKKYINGVENFSEQQSILADVNLDGLINDIDSQVLSKYCAGWYNSLPMIYGDVDENGKLDNRDLTMTTEYINGTRTFNEGQKYIADVNIDGKVDSKDLGLIQQCINGKITLPQAFIKNEEIKKDIIKDTEIITGFNVNENATKVSDVISNFTDNVKTIVYNKNYEEIDSSKIVGTGYTIENYYDIKELPNQEYTVVIYGDTTGDGLITPVDALAIIKNRNNKVLFSKECYTEAGRIVSENKEESPSAIDALAIIKYTNGRYDINQSK